MCICHLHMSSGGEGTLRQLVKCAFISQAGRIHFLPMSANVDIRGEGESPTSSLQKPIIQNLRDRRFGAFLETLRLS